MSHKIRQGDVFVHDYSNGNERLYIALDDEATLDCSPLRGTEWEIYQSKYLNLIQGETYLFNINDTEPAEGMTLKGAVEWMKKRLKEFGDIPVHKIRVETDEAIDTWTRTKEVK